MDHNNDGHVTWNEYKAQLLGLDPAKVDSTDNTTIQKDANGPLSKQADHWLRADFNQVNNIIARKHLLLVSLRMHVPSIFC